MDKQSFRQILLKDFLTEFLEHMDSSYRFVALSGDDTALEALRKTTFGQRYLFIPPSTMKFESDLKDSVRLKAPIDQMYKNLAHINEQESLNGYKVTEIVSLGSKNNWLIGVFGDHNYFLSQFLYDKLDIFDAPSKYRGNSTAERKLLASLPNGAFVVMSKNSYEKHFQAHGLGSMIGWLSARRLDSKTRSMLDLDKCRDLLSEIEREVLLESNNDILSVI